MKPIHTILLIAAFCVTGCDTLNVKQYRVTGVTPNSADARKLKSVLQSVADKAGLKDCTSGSGKTNLLVLYALPERSLPTLSAQFVQEGVTIDLFGGFGTPPPFRQAKRLLGSTLSTEFGSQFYTLR